MAPGIAAQPRQEPAAAKGESPTPISLDSLSVTRERPLFSPSRRPASVEEVRAAPPPPPPPSAPTPPSAPPNLMFFGTFESNEELGAAVQVPPSEKAMIVRFGAYIGGWRVSEITRHRLVLSLDDRTAEFTLFGSKSPNASSGVSQGPAIEAQQAQPRPDGGGQNGVKGPNN